MRRALIILSAILLCGCAAERELPYDYDLADYIELAEYRGISYVPIGDPERRTVEAYDRVTAEISAEVEGVERLFSGEYSFVVGESGFLPGFDEALVGMAVGESRTLELRVPDDYPQAPELAGLPAVVTVRVTALDLSALRQANADTLFEIVCDNSEVLAYPEAELAEYVEDYRELYSAFAAQYNMELYDYVEAFFAAQPEQFDELCLTNAEASVRRDLVIYAIARAEGLEPGRAELEQSRPKWLETYGYASENDMPVGWDDPGVAASLERMAIEQMVKDFIYESASPAR